MREDTSPTDEPARDAPVAEGAVEGEDSTRKVGSDALVVGLGYLASFAYPLVSLPFLTRVVGVVPLGHLMFALAVLQVVIYVIDFGFGMSALRRIAVAGSREERSLVVVSTLAAKALLWVVSGGVLMGIVLLAPQLREYWAMYLVGLLAIGVGAMYPTWLLQGTGRVKAFALLTATSRLIALVFLVLTVRGPEDLVLAMLWQQLPLALSALTSWLMIWRVWHAVQRVPLRFADVTEALRDSFPLFVSNASGIILGSSNSVVLGVVATPSQVAFFGAAERFSNAVRGVMRGVVDVMLPRMTREGDHAAHLQRVITIGLIGIYALAGLALILTAPWFVPWYLGAEMAPAVPVTQLLGVALAFVGLTQSLQLRATAAHRFRQVARISVLGAIVHLALVLPAGWLWGAVGAGIAVAVSDGLLAAMFVVDHLMLRRRGGEGAGDDPEGGEDDPVMPTRNPDAADPLHGRRRDEGVPVSSRAPTAGGRHRADIGPLPLDT